MSTISNNDVQLLQGVLDGRLRVVKAAHGAGANVDGSTEQPLPPVVAATIANHVRIVNFLLGNGADPDRPVTQEVPCPSFGTGMYTAIPGERALHIVARSGNVEIARLLLRQPRADPNATDCTGRTPLLVACLGLHHCVEVARLLLEAGADPTLAQENGFTSLHAAASSGYMDLVDMLYTRAPATLNSCTSMGGTALFAACCGGHGSMVSRLLSLGAVQPTTSIASNNLLCPLEVATSKGFVDVVRVLITEGGIRAVGGEWALTQALFHAIRSREARILRLLLTVDGRERRSEWANTNRIGQGLLLYGAGYCCPAAVSALLEAGADEAARDSDGWVPGDVIGVHLGRGDGAQMDRGEEVAIRRMLQRGPAYRARSWAWPSDEEAGAGGSGDGDTAAAAAAAAAAADAAVLPSPPAGPKAPVIDVRIFRPKEKSGSKFFVRLIGRYCAKD